MRSEQMNVYTVAQVNTYIKNLFTRDFALKQIAVKGEVSNCKYHSSGHIYFTLKDGSGVLSAVMFAGNRNGLRFAMREGQKVIVLGGISVYERDGKYQMYAREIHLDGQGDLFQQMEELKKRLGEMGMFAPEYKQPIPPFARKVGIVTASTGAAIRDIFNIAHRRNPYVQLILCPAIVQGESAAQSIVRGIERLDEMGLDVIIVGRGGGSIEDLWAFNEEIVARAIFHCNTPIITGIGHETDTTIADYVADLRAPTPSAAAELAVCDWFGFCDSLEKQGMRLKRLMNNRLDQENLKLANLTRRLERRSPQSILDEKRQGLINRERQLDECMYSLLEQRKHQLALMATKLESMSPLAAMQKGYAYVTLDTGKPIRSVHEVRVGEPITVSLADGQLQARIEDRKALQE